MKKLLLAFLCLCGCSVHVIKCPAVQIYHPNLTDVQKAALSPTYQQKVKDFATLTIPYILEDNTIYSPTSYLLALCMLSEMATNELHQELLDTLGFANQSEVRMFAKDLFAASFANEESKLLLSNSTWCSDVFNVNPELVNSLINNYYSTYYQGDLKSEACFLQLQQWYRQASLGLLELDENPFLEIDTYMALMSGIYASANWISAPTVGEVNYLEGKVKGLSLRSSMLYYQDEDCESAYLPLVDGFSLLVVEPKHDDYQLNIDKSQYVPQQVLVNMPQVDITTQIDLLEVSKQIGLSHITEFGQLNNMTLNQEDIGQVVAAAYQDARIVIDETGVKASAITTIIEGPTSVPDEPLLFEVDNPFFYVLLYNDVPHFIGTYN